MNETRGYCGFDYESFHQGTIAKMFSGDKEFTGKDGLLAPLLKDLLDAALSGDMRAHVEQNRPNRRNAGRAVAQQEQDRQDWPRPGQRRDADLPACRLSAKLHSL